MACTPPEILPLAFSDSAAGTADCAVQWRRSARARRVSLRIDARLGAVVVTLPPRAGRRQGMALLATHAGWVAARLAALAPHVPLAEGETVMVGGAPHVIRQHPAPAGEACLEAGALLVPGPLGELPHRTAAWLRAEALRRIATLVAGHGTRLAVAPAGIVLKDTRSRWGSCAPDRRLAFSWRLVMAPAWVLDYVVAQEVAHLRELNHSPRFWTLVEQLTPHRAAAVAWLKAHGPGLLRVG